MSQGKPERTLKPIPLDVLRDYELDLDIFADRAKAGIIDENARDAFECLIDFTRRTIGEIKLLKGRITVISSDAKILRDHFRDEGRVVKGVDLRWRGVAQ
jgi:hypothetical protein